MRKDKRLPDGLEIGFEGGLAEEVTAHAGIALLVDTGRRSGVVGLADRVLPAKKNPKGLGPGQMVESLVVLSALGGECLDDFGKLRGDLGLEAILGYELPAPSTARASLERFHEEEVLAGRPAQGSFLPQESAGLAGLGELVRQSVRAYVAAVKPGPRLTMDVDAHLVESSKREALPTYEGFRGYQPLIVTWAESEGLILRDQFRDGNVPAGRGIGEQVDEAYAALPEREGGWQVWIRSDSAAYEHKVLKHWEDREWKYVVTADMSRQLRAEINGLGEEEWRPWAIEKDGKVREWAEVAYVPSEENEKKDSQPRRYVAWRIRPAQGRLFEDGNTVRVFAVVSNEWEMEGRCLLEWHQDKAGTVEHSHRVLKDELGGGVYPSGKLGANAAWLRLQVLTNNLLVLMKAVALDAEYRQARPKRLRFAIFNHVGRVVRHARQNLMRVSQEVMKRLLGLGLARLRAANWAYG
jgi:hypothetical protein